MAPTLSRASLRLLAVLAIPTALCAQVPVGWAAMSTFRGANATTEGGVAIFDPTVAANPTPVTGLPTDLTGTTTSGVTEGASAVLVRPSDGALIVAEHAPGSQTSVDIHVITIDAQAAMVSDTPFSVGTPGTFGWVDQMAWLPGNRVLFSHRGLSHPNLPRPQGLGILDLNTGAVSELVMSYFPAGTINCCAASADGTMAYFGVFGLGSAPTSSRVMEVPVAGGTPMSLTTVPGSVLQLGVDNDGGLLIGSNTAGGGDLWKFDFATRVPTRYSTLMQEFNALAVDRVTGDYICTTYDSPGYTNFSARRVTGGTSTPIFVLPWAAAGPSSGYPSGIAIRDVVYEYETQEASQNTYAWEMFPLPSGLPTIGNAAFSIDMSSTPGTAIGVMAVSLGRADTPSPFGRLLVDAAQLEITATILPAALVSLPLPIPNDPNLVGLEVFCQALHVEGTTILTTSGLAFTIQ